VSSRESHYFCNNYAIKSLPPRKKETEKQKRRTKIAIRGLVERIFFRYFISLPAEKGDFRLLPAVDRRMFDFV
jgi:hypothetical protein